jgi:hypothetical protein
MTPTRSFFQHEPQQRSGFIVADRVPCTDRARRAHLEIGRFLRNGGAIVRISDGQRMGALRLDCAAPCDVHRAAGATAIAPLIRWSAATFTLMLIGTVLVFLSSLYAMLAS